MVLEFFQKKYVLDACDVLDTLSIWDHLELFEVKYHLYAFWTTWTFGTFPSFFEIIHTSRLERNLYRHSSNDISGHEQIVRR